MNIKKLTLSVVAVLAFVGVVSAQQSKTDESVEFRPHWNLQLQGGIASTIGESSSFGDMISPAIFVNAGYKFHHAWGLRLGLGGWQGRGVVVSPEMDYSFKFIQGNADITLDLTSLIGGFNHRRVCSVYAFAGLGVLHGFDNDEATAINAKLPASPSHLEYLWDSKTFVAGRFGAGVDFRASERVSIGLEANANILSDHFNSKKAGNCDWQINMLAGVTVRLGKNHQPSAAYQAKVDEALAIAEAEKAARIAAEKRAAEEKAAAEAKAAAEKAAAEKAEAERLAAEKAAAEQRHAALAEEHSDNIFFRIGSAHIRQSEAEKIDALVEWMLSNDEFRVSIVGYADKETGSAATNAKLSERRAQNVKAALLKAGIAEERIDIAHKGDTVQPFEEPSKNRVVICTLE